MTLSVLHLLKNDALFHLTDILFFNYTHQMLEGVVDLVRVELVALAHALAKEVISALL